jgi:hypothetical protein
LEWIGKGGRGESFMGGRERREGKQVFELDQKVGVQDFKNEKLKKYIGF